MTLNPGTNSGLSPAELTFARKIKSVFNKLLPKENKKPIKKKTDAKSHIPGENIFFKEDRNRKEIRKVGVIDKHIGRLMYIKTQKRLLRDITTRSGKGAGRI